jgi:DNA repair protein RadD
MRELRDYQIRGLDALRQTIRQGVKRVAIQLPTGGGKTLCAANIANGAMAKGTRLAFVVPRIALVDQTVEEFYKEEIRDVGVIQANHPLTDWSKPIQVCSIDTVRSKGVFPEANVVIFDEAHLFYEAHKKWMKEKPNTIFIALSATPWTKGLGKYFDSLLVIATTKELIEQGWLSPFRVFAAGHPDLSDVKIVAGEYHEGQLSTAMQQGTLVADIVQTWKQKWGKDKTLAFAVDCAHAQAIQKRFIEAGIECGYQDASTPSDERREIKRKFHNSDFPVVVSVGTLTLGVDWDVRCISYCRPTRSEMLFVQAIGRALRTAPGKEHALILDHSDTTQRLGFVTDIHHEHLEGGKDKAPVEQRKAPLPKECKSCGYLKPPRTAVCPNCGFQASLVSGVMEQDGELVEITPNSKPRKSKHEYTMAEKAQFFAELKRYGMDKGRKSGWAAYSYREKFSVWPDHSMKYIPPAAEVSFTVEMWVRSRNIKWAKAKRKAEAEIRL